MIREMRKKNKQLSEQEARRLLAAGEYGILATAGEDYPYGVPVNYAVAGDMIYIHGTLEPGQRDDNIRQNNRVCFTVVGETAVLSEKFAERFESVIVFGTAELAEGEEKEAGLEALIDKYSPEYKEKGMKYIQAAKDQTAVYRISIDKITGKASP